MMWVLGWPEETPTLTRDARLREEMPYWWLCDSTLAIRWIFTCFRNLLVSPGFGPTSAHEARWNACILSVSCRSMTNLAKMLAVAECRRNSGMLWRRALATTSSEGGMPGRMVRSQEPKACQTRCGKATARY